MAYNITTGNLITSINPSTNGMVKTVAVSWALVRTLLGNRMLWCSYIGQYCTIALSYFFITWFPIYLVQARGMNVMEAGFATMIPAVSGFLGGIAGGVISDMLIRHGWSVSWARKTPYIVGMLVGCCLVLSAFTESNVLIVLLMTLAFFGKGTAAGAGTWAIVSDTAPREAVGLAGAIVRETLLAGGQACRPLIAREGLSAVLVEPAIKLLQDKGADIRFGHELRGFGMSADRVSELNFGDDKVALAPGDTVVMAVPPRPAASLLPGLKTPTKFRAIVNAHFRFDPPKDLPPILGVVGGLVEWLFAFPQRLSITISGADRLVDMPREELAQAIWRDICKAGGVQGELPPWQIVRERRATFEATPEQNALRPGAVTGWKNLFLAGDWTDTGLPATIEGSVRSGDRAADLVLRQA